LLVSASTPYVLAAVAAFGGGAVIGYVLNRLLPNRHWTFADQN
jgi:hypothetical protein